MGVATLGVGIPQLLVRPLRFHYFIPTCFFLCFFLFMFCCSHALTLMTTLMQEFHIFYIHTEWNFLFLALLRLNFFWLGIAIKQKNIIIYRHMMKRFNFCNVKLLSNFIWPVHFCQEKPQAQVTVSPSR